MYSVVLIKGDSTRPIYIYILFLGALNFGSSSLEPSSSGLNCVSAIELLQHPLLPLLDKDIVCLVWIKGCEDFREDYSLCLYPCTTYRTIEYGIIVELLASSQNHAKRNRAVGNAIRAGYEPK